MPTPSIARNRKSRLIGLLRSGAWDFRDGSAGGRNRPWAAKSGACLKQTGRERLGRDELPAIQDREFDESRDMSSRAEPSSKHPQARGHLPVTHLWPKSFVRYVRCCRRSAYRRVRGHGGGHRRHRRPHRCRVSAHAGAGELVVSRTVRDLSGGGGRDRIRRSRPSHPEGRSRHLGSCTQSPRLAHAAVALNGLERRVSAVPDNGSRALIRLAGGLQPVRPIRLRSQPDPVHGPRHSPEPCP